MHPRNRFQFGYEFKKLVDASPALGRFVRPNPYGEPSIDYANPAAVRALNQALLKSAYSLEHWDVPKGYLCPPVPGRCDYIHVVADLLAAGKDAEEPRDHSIRVLDIGMGANAIYPLLGASEYGWRFVGTDTDSAAFQWAKKMIARNAAIASLIECRFQPRAQDSFRNVFAPGEFFHATMCNPPFHASAAEARAGNERKRRNLRTDRPGVSPRNFGGQAAELWCKGGELGFVLRMIDQSVEFRDRCGWFTTLVSRSAHLRRLQSAAHQAGASEVKTVAMAQGQKQSRVLAWTFAATASTKRAR
jgi:23S rRNA (adenine1618-N6)-methyltransferase